MGKIIGNTTATPMAIPDWNQMDETKADYIKNKPTIVDLIARTNGSRDLGGISPIYYCTTLDDALVTVIEDNLGEYGSLEFSDDSVCAVYMDHVNDNNRRYVIILLDDITVPQVTYEIPEPVEIIFAGKFLTIQEVYRTFFAFYGDTYLNGTLGGGIRGCGNAIVATQFDLAVFHGNVIVEGGSYSLDVGTGHSGDSIATPFAVNNTAEKAIFKNLSVEMNYDGSGKGYGLTYCLAKKLIVDNVNISVNGNSRVKESELHGLYFNQGTEACVKNTHISVRATSKAPRVHGMTLLNGKCIDLINNKVYVDSGNNDSDTTKGGAGHACYISGNVKKVVIIDGEYEGVHTSISIYAKLAMIDGGKFVSCSHGGFYYSGASGRCYVKNAQLGTCAYSGIFNQSEMGNPNPVGAFYVSGDNSKVYMDNCEYLFTDDTQYAGGVLRGDNKNISLYISNMTVPEGHKLRADNGNYVYVGTGTNISKDNMCTIYNKPIDEATLIYTGYNEYTYENSYTNKKCDIIPENVANALKSTKSGASVSVDDVSPISHQVHVGLSAKNFFYFPNANSKTFGGVTFIPIRKSNEFILSGTASAETSTGILSDFPLAAGQYRVSIEGLYAKSGNDRIYVSSSGNVLVNYIYDGSPKTFTLEQDGHIGLQLIIAEGSVYENKTVKIMLERIPAVTDDAKIIVTAVDDVENPTVTRTVTATIADGATFESIAPNMTVFTDNDGVAVDIEYNRDTNSLTNDVRNMQEDIMDNNLRIGIIEGRLDLVTPFRIIKTTAGEQAVPDGAQNYARIYRVGGRKLLNKAETKHEACMILALSINGEIVWKNNASITMWAAEDYIYYASGRWIFHSEHYIVFGSPEEVESQKEASEDTIYSQAPNSTIYSRVTPIETDITDKIEGSPYIDVSGAKYIYITSTKNETEKNGALSVLYEV